MLQNTPNDLPPEAALAYMVQGMKVTQALYAATKLNIFDILRDGPKTVEDIALAAQAQAPALGRLLRFLTTLNVLTQDELNRFAATAMGDQLRSDHPRSLRALALLSGSQLFWRPWGDLFQTLVTGQPAFDRVFGEPTFAYLGHNPEAAAIFNAAMTSGTTSMLQPLLDAYDFSTFGKIVDVAGGHGALLRAILERIPTAHGVIYEMPAVVAEARELWGTPTETRCELIAGDMFEAVPAGGDAYLLKYIIHDWDDEAAILILKNCRRAINPGGKLILVERIIQPSNQPDPAKWVDVDMLVMVTGRERTPAEYRRLYAAAGFELKRVIPAGEFALIEGSPI